MTFAQLLQNLGSYLDFSKRVATTVPGLVMALALVLLTSSVPNWAIRPFACGETLQAERRAEAAAWRLGQFDTSWKPSDSSLPNPDERVFLRTNKRSLKRDYAVALSRASLCREACAPQAAAAQTALKSLQAFDGGLEGGRWATYETTIASAIASDSAAKSAKDDEETLAVADWDIAQNTGQGRCASVPTTWSDIANQVLLFGLLGFALGVVLDPVSKAIFLQIFPDVAAGMRRRSANRLARAGAALLKPIALFVPANAVADATRRANRDNDAHPLDRRSAQFFIGRGVITASEYQDLIDRDYHLSELTIGLVVPLFLIGAAVLLHERSLGYELLGVMWGIAAISTAIVFARIGIRRNVEFTSALNDLIAGRLEKLDEDQAKDKRTVDLAQLHILIDRATELMRRRTRSAPRS